MKQIIKASDAILNILGNEKNSSAGYRMIHYCVPVQVDDGTLLFNTLTRELLLLTPEEYADALNLPYLRKQWFVIPQDTDEKKLVELVRWVQGSMRKEPKNITGYTILTTTDCNARCFYCYELGRSRVPMSDETALKTADFIRDHCGGQPVSLTWFGGEPLYNHRVIDLICQRLRDAQVAFSSFMVSNAYLFDDELTDKAVNSWNLKKVQITLDGTEDVYNRCKAFIYRQGSAYQVVLANIARLLDKGIAVSVRMNLDFHNADDLLLLAEELAARFAGKHGLQAYAHLIFDDKVPWDQRYSMEQWTRLYALKQQLDDKLAALGLYASKEKRLNRTLRHTHCMADSGNTLVITPDGHLGLCEHFSESELIGHIDSPQRDRSLIASWRQRADEIPECATCFCYPGCIELKKCPDRIACIPPRRQAFRREMELAMRNELRIWQARNPSETGEAN